MQESTTPHPPQAVPLSRLRARSRCGSDSHSGCHSTPHRRFATHGARHTPAAQHSPRRNAFTDNPSVLLRNPPPFTQGRLPPLRHLSVPPLPECEAHTPVGEGLAPPAISDRRTPSPSPHSTQSHSRYNLCLYSKETTRVTDTKIAAAKLVA